MEALIAREEPCVGLAAIAALFIGLNLLIGILTIITAAGFEYIPM